MGTNRFMRVAGLLAVTAAMLLATESRASLMTLSFSGTVTGVNLEAGNGSAFGNPAGSIGTPFSQTIVWNPADVDGEYRNETGEGNSVAWGETGGMLVTTTFNGHSGTQLLLGPTVNAYLAWDGVFGTLGFLIDARGAGPLWLQSRLWITGADLIGNSNFYQLLNQGLPGAGSPNDFMFYWQDNAAFSGQVNHVSLNTASVPEPATLGFMALALALLGVARMRVARKRLRPIPAVRRA